MNDRVRVVPYEPRWPYAFEDEARQLREALGAELLAVEHVGSTSVPGLDAKPTLDIALVVRRIPPPTDVLAMLAAVGYEHRGEQGIPGRHFFRKVRGGERTHHLHVHSPGHPHFDAQLLFRRSGG